MIQSRLVLAPLALGLAAVLGGCALVERLAPQGAATPAATVVSAEEAGVAFTDTICTFNDEAFAFDRTWSDLEAPLRTLQEAASLSRIEAETAKRQLESVSWPADIADDMLVVEEYFQQRIDKLDQVITAETVEELDDIDFTTPEEVNSAAAEIEASLQLGEDYCPS